MVIHLAAYANIRESLEDPEKFYVNNVLMAKPLFDWCRDTNTRLLYASSSAVEEEYWENPYAMTKWVNEMMDPIKFCWIKIHYSLWSRQSRRHDVSYAGR